MKNWLGFTVLATVLMGVWGAFAGLPSQHGFPETMIYVVWALTMIPPALYALHRAGWRLQHDGRALVLGLVIGVLGAGGQMILFYAVKDGPTYLIFPIISMAPVITIGLSYCLLKERTGRLGMVGIVLAVLALPLFDYTPGAATHTYGPWFLMAVGVLLAWGLQSYFIKLANATMEAESIFFYMTAAGLLFIPLALLMTDFSRPINMGWQGPYLAAATQVLNALGALALVYAFRYGKALVVSPLVNAGAPLLTTVLSVLMAATLPGSAKLLGIGLSLAAALLLALQPEEVVKS